MPRQSSAGETARLEARIPVHIYDAIRRAARLRGMSLTSYLVATAGEEAKRDIEEVEILRLSREDQIRFAEALSDPPPANDRLNRAAQRHAELIVPR